jgi:hypothetical protein
MLEGKVKIRKKTAVLFKKFQEGQGEIIGVYVEEPYPKRTGKAGKLFKEFGKTVLSGRKKGARPVFAVGAQVLADEA